MFGARGTGKSTLVRTLIPPDEGTLVVDLLRTDHEERLHRNPEELESQIRANLHRLECIFFRVQTIMADTADADGRAFCNFKG